MWGITCLSLLPFLSQIFEKLVFKRVSDFLCQINFVNLNLDLRVLLILLFFVCDCIKCLCASAQSSVLIFLDVSKLCHSEPWNPHHYTVQSGNFRQTIQLLWIVSHWMFIQCVLARTSKCLNLTTSPLGDLRGGYLDLPYSLSSLGQMAHSHGFSYHCYVEKKSAEWHSACPSPLDDFTTLAFQHSSVISQTGWGTVTFSSIIRRLNSWYFWPIWQSHKILTFNLAHHHWPTLKLQGVMIEDQLSYSEHVFHLKVLSVHPL